MRRTGSRIEWEPDMHPAADSLDLAPLYRRLVFRSSKKVHSHVQVAHALSEHDMYWKGENVDTALCKARLHSLEISSLRYGAEVVIRPKPFDDFVLVQTTLSGIAEIEADGHKISLPQGRTALVAPKRNLRLRWQSGCEQLILKIPFRLLDEIGGRHDPDDRLDRRQAAGSAIPAPAVPSLFLLPPQTASHWGSLMQSLVSVLSLPDLPGADTPWVGHLERSAVQFLWPQLSSSRRSAEEPADGASFGVPSDASIGGSALRRLDALEDYIQSRLGAPLALADLARAAGISERVLNLLCHRHYGVSPMDFLRNIRLDTARAYLMAQSNASVTETAFRFGFEHLGRFSAYYRERFSELPKQTLAACHRIDQKIDRKPG
jgi:AraC-like DNA-binding protein